ncbi:RDD family protein [Streptomyces sp. NPDC101118]|uniref:RDD family protein n=1 Tax=Streptomyces sp. NPDC101118 TaxID=3366109 RepID=UPI00381EF668
MTASPGDGETAPREGYYPDPSIPGFVRYWNGSSWVPGTSRPAASAGAPGASARPAPAPAPPTTPRTPQTEDVPAVPAAEETGPVFFDELPEAEASEGGAEDGAGAAAPAARTEDAVPEDRRPGDPRARDPRTGPEPDDARPEWKADAAQQSGFGGDRDRKVTWGEPAAAAAPTVAGPDAEPAERTPAAAAPGPSPSVPAQASPAAPAPAVALAKSGRATSDGPAAPASLSKAGPGTTTPDRPVWPEAGSAAAAPVAGAGSLASPASPAPAKSAVPSTSTAAATAPAAAPAAPTAADAPAVTPSPAASASPAASPGAAADGPALPAGWPAAGGVPAQAGAPGQDAAGWRPPTDELFRRMAEESSRPAGLGRRLGARIVDSLVTGAVTAAAALPFVTPVTEHVEDKIDAARLSGETVTVWLLDGTTGGYLAAVLGVYLVFGVLYEAVPVARWGRTLGKKLFGVRVCGLESRQPPSFGAALGRWLVYGGLGILGIGLFNALWCLVDRPWRQCWHDKAAGTFVAR